ncbi:MAG: hypothetical protein ACPGID_08180 [Rubricella sp.]
MTRGSPRRTATKLLAALALSVAASGAVADPSDFHTPVTVGIEGYSGHAMEPFLSRDGRWLFFNTRNQPQDQTDLHLAERIDDTLYRYLGPLDGANSDALDGVPSMDASGTFFFVSPRAYDTSRNTLWQGRFAAGEVTDIRELEGDFSRREPIWLNIDAEISADGQTLYYVESRWRLLRGGIASANLLLARRMPDGSFARVPSVEDPFTAINSDLLEFAPAITEDELTLYFTRVDEAALREGVDRGFGIFVATRHSTAEPFGHPRRIAAITGYVEAPTIAPGDCAILFHKRIDGTFVIQRAERRDC